MMRIPKPLISEVERATVCNEAVTVETLYLSNLYGKGQPGITLLCKESEIQDEFDSYLFVKGIRYSKIARGVNTSDYPIMRKVYDLLHDSLTEEGKAYFSNEDMEIYVHYGFTFLGKNFGTLCFEKANNRLCFKPKIGVSQFLLDSINSIILEVLYNLEGDTFNGVKSSFFKEFSSVVKIANSVYANKNFGKDYIVLSSDFNLESRPLHFSKNTLNVIG
jgi:hypothetical protein